MKILRLLALLLAFPLACLAASTPVSNGIMSGTLTFNQSATVGLIPWANIGLTAGALPGVNSITAVAGSSMTFTTGAIGIVINANGSLVFPYNASAGLLGMDGSGNVSPLANGINGTVLSMVAGTPTWAVNATGNVSNSGTPTAGQLGQWVTATTIQGVSGINSITVGATTPSTGAFTTLSASSTVSGTGFSTYLASPPAIGGSAPAAGAFTTLSASSTSSFTGVMTISSAVTWGSGVRQTFNPNGTTPGFNPGSNAGDPASPSNGDVWYDSTGNKLRAYINGSAVSLGSSGVSSITGTGGQILANGTSGSGQVNGVTLTLPAALTGLTSITASASNSFTITAGSGGNFNVILTPTGSGNVQDSSTTASTGTNNGALVVAGGAGFAGAIWAGSIQGTPIGSSSVSTGAFTTITASGTVIMSGNATVSGTLTTSAYNNNGLSQLSGNVGIGQAPNAGIVLGIAGSASGNGATGAEFNSNFTTSGNSQGGFGLYVAGSITMAANTGTGYNSIYVATPSIVSGTLANGYMLQLAAPAAGMTGGFLNAGTSTLTGNVGIGATATTTSPLHISGIPTSASGLATGDVWSNSGVLTIH